MDDQNFQSFLCHQQEVKGRALAETLFIKPLSLTNKKARFPGFHQRRVQFHAGQCIVPGALPLPIGITLHESVCMRLDDGVRLYSDIFLPPTYQDISSDAKHFEKIPALIAWSPYGKQKGTTLLDDFPMRAGVPRHWTSGLEKWEGPDPAFWCANGYAIINVDTRGAYTSEGDLLLLGHQEAEDGAKFATWVSEQSWCNGKVAFTGNSWLAIVQWKIGSLRPKGLAALAPWEGFQDLYREHICSGGIPRTGFVEGLMGKLAGQGRLEDIPQMLRRDSLWSAYWEDKMAVVSNIEIPVYAVASWSNPLHTPGTFKAWEMVSDTVPKWLRVHNTQEWSDYYTSSNVQDLKRFFDYYLHGRTDNGWLTTPKVRLSVLHFGLGDLGDTINRAEANFPLPRTRYVRHYLAKDGKPSLVTKSPVKGTTVSYDAQSGHAIFDFEMPSVSETTGYFMAHLVMSCEGHNEMDVFVQVEKLGSKKSRQGVLAIPVRRAVVRALLKFMHDWQIGVKNTGPLFYWGPNGALRASHALDKDDTSDFVAQPRYLHLKKLPLRAGERRVLDIPMKPCGMYWQKGDTLRFTVSGREPIPFPIPGVKPPATDNKGTHIIHCGDRGDNSSFVLIPYV